MSGLLALNVNANALGKYGRPYIATMYSGDGIGWELTDYVKEVLSYAGIPADFETLNVDKECDDEEEVHLAILSIKQNCVAIKFDTLRYTCVPIGVHTICVYVTYVPYVLVP